LERADAFKKVKFHHSARGWNMLWIFFAACVVIAAGFAVARRKARMDARRAESERALRLQQAEREREALEQLANYWCQRVPEGFSETQTART
jgi:hypothetical protein